MNDILPIVLTVAGSDSGGGAGIQADLKTFSALGCLGTTALSCVTAQNPARIISIVPLAPDAVTAQIRAICDGFPVSAAKTGMLCSAAIVRAVAGAVAEFEIEKLVVDPVMVASSGARLLDEDALAVLSAELLPKAEIITPNIPEAEMLCGRRIATIPDMRSVAVELGERYGVACVIKGGHRAGASGEVVDVLFAGGELSELAAARIGSGSLHGTGCTFSAAIAAYLARGSSIADAVAKAKVFVGLAIEFAERAGAHGILNWFHSR